MKRQKIKEVIKDLEKFRERWLEWTQYDPIERYATALQYAIDHLNTEQPSQDCCCVCGFGEANIVICPIHSTRPENKPSQECPEKHNFQTSLSGKVECTKCHKVLKCPMPHAGDSTCEGCNEGVSIYSTCTGKTPKDQETPMERMCKKIIKIPKSQECEHEYVCIGTSDLSNTYKCNKCGDIEYMAIKKSHDIKLEEGIYKVIYDIERKTCASEKCSKTCPAYPENKEYPCGVRLTTRELSKAILDYVEGKHVV